MAMVTWVGGNLFFLFVLRPALRRGGASSDLSRRIGARFKEAVDLSMWVLVITGGILVYDRLTVNVDWPYMTALGVKLLLSGAMFLLAISLGRRGAQRRASPIEGTWTDLLPRGLGLAIANVLERAGRLLTPTTLLAVLGPIIVLLGLLLRAMD
jgi:putative copper export protein